jgi:tetratricopeptide (TPR) repeat protein
VVTSPQRLRRNLALAAALALALTGASASAAEASGGGAQVEAPDHLALAALLVRDGHLDRAELELSRVDLAAAGADVARYHTLTGLIALQRTRHAAAVSAFEAALAAGATEPQLWVFLARERFALERWEAAAQAVDRVPAPALQAQPKLRLLKAQALYRLGRLPDAYAALADAERADPTLVEASRQRILLLVEMGLHHAAAEAGRAFLARTGGAAADHIVLAEALRRGRAFDDAIVLLEVARLRFPADPQILGQLGRAYLDAGRPLTAAALLERAAVSEPAKALEAAELYRRGGRLSRAVYVNARVPDQRSKIRQRLGLLVELGRFEEAAALGPRLERLGLASDDQLVYAVAYAFFRTGRYAAAERWLKRVTSAAAFDKAAGLRKVMEQCRQGAPCE